MVMGVVSGMRVLIWAARSQESVKRGLVHPITGHCLCESPNLGYKPVIG